MFMAILPPLMSLLAVWYGRGNPLPLMSLLAVWYVRGNPPLAHVSTRCVICSWQSSPRSCLYSLCDMFVAILPSLMSLLAVWYVRGNPPLAHVSTRCVICSWQYSPLSCLFSLCDMVVAILPSLMSLLAVWYVRGNPFTQFSTHCSIFVAILPSLIFRWWRHKIANKLARGTFSQFVNIFFSNLDTPMRSIFPRVHGNPFV